MSLGTGSCGKKKPLQELTGHHWSHPVCWWFLRNSCKRSQGTWSSRLHPPGKCLHAGCGWGRKEPLYSRNLWNHKRIIHFVVKPTWPGEKDKLPRRRARIDTLEFSKGKKKVSLNSDSSIPYRY